MSDVLESGLQVFFVTQDDVDYHRVVDRLRSASNIREALATLASGPDPLLTWENKDLGIGQDQKLKDLFSNKSKEAANHKPIHSPKPKMP